MKSPLLPALLLSLTLLVGCSARHSDHDVARTPAARPESLEVASGTRVEPGQITRSLQVELGADGRISLREEWTGTKHFKEWMDEQFTYLQQSIKGIERVDAGAETHFVRDLTFGSVEELNSSGMMEAEVYNSPLYYTLTWRTETEGYSATELAQVFTPPAAAGLSAEEWGSYLLDAYHVRFLVTDERTGAQYSWERSAREIGSGQRVAFNDRAWRPLAWVLISVAGALLAFVTWAGLMGERRWAPLSEES